MATDSDLSVLSRSACIGQLGHRELLIYLASLSASIAEYQGVDTSIAATMARACSQGLLCQDSKTLLAIIAANNVAVADELGVSPSATPFTAYFGRSASETLDEAGVSGLGSESRYSVGGSYSFAAGSGYVYLAFPVTAGSPRAGDGFQVSGFPMSLAGAAEGYSGDVNGWGFQTVSVGGVDYRVFRSYFTLAGSVTVQVST
jgi:hypothetical protein